MKGVQVLTYLTLGFALLGALFLALGGGDVDHSILAGVGLICLILGFISFVGLILSSETVLKG